MKKYFISGVLAIAISAVFTGCSKSTDLYDEGAQQKASIEQIVNNYDVAFVNHFGSIASDQDWGFGQAKGIGSLTRGITTGASHKNGAPAECAYKVPSVINNVGNGVVANEAQADFNAGKGVDIDGVQNKDVDFVNFWMQHFNIAQGSHSPLASIEVYETGKGWVEIPGFWKGNGNDVTYFEKNTKSKGTALLTGMGGKAGDPNPNSPGYGKLFRFKTTETGDYSYNYKFLDFKSNAKDVEFLVLGFNAGNGDWWEFVIRPAIGQNGLVEEGRIMCEDLGDTKDFDFNDVVFDARRYDNGNIEITLLAAGGILPIYVAGEDVHAHLGSMKNTGEGGDVKTYTFTVTGYPSILDIPVTVVLDANDTQNAQKYELKAPIGAVPQKICAPINTNWPREYKDIKEAYSEFNDWVQNNNPKRWMTVEDTSKTYSIFID